jgi:hypothetical protein
MSEPAKAEKIAPPKAAATKPKSTAPLPKQPGQSPATPTLAKLRRALGDLIVGYKTGRTHMFGIYAANLRAALDAAGKVRNVATEAERKDLDGLELRARMLLIHVPGPDAKPTSDDGRLVIDWDYISDSIDQVVPGIGQVATKAPQQYRDCFEAVWRSTLYMKDAFREQWAEIQKHWFEFLYATATVVALETAALIASATPGTQLLGIVIQGLIIAFVAYAAVEIGAEAGQLTEGFWHSVQGANGDASKIDIAAAKFARLVIYILRLLAETVAGGVLAKLSMKGIRHIAGEQIVTPRVPAVADTPSKGGTPATKPSNTPTTHESSPSSGSGAKPSTVERTRVTEPVKGVWEQTEHPRFQQPEFSDMTIVEDVFHENGVSTAVTKVLDASKKRVGHVIRTYNQATGVLELSEAFLDKVPNKIVPSNGKMLTPTGTPTQTYLTLRQMRALGIEYGTLRKVKMSTIQNIQSIIQLHVMKTTEPTMSLHEKVRRTASVSYADTTITQSGHRIVDVKFGDAHVISDNKLGRLMEYYERDFSYTKPRDKTMVEKHDALLKQYGKNGDHQIVTRETKAIYNYDIEITLAPIK